MRARGAAAGFELRSSLVFRTLRSGPATPLEIVEAEGLDDAPGDLLHTWRARPHNPFHGRLYVRGGSFTLWASDAGWFRIDPELRRIDVEPTDDPLHREMRLLGIPAAICAAQLGDISVHAASVDVNGGAVLLAGPSHSGKTTLAAALTGAGHRLLAEDATRCATGDPSAAYPGPALIRLRSDVAPHVALAGERLPAATGDRMHVLIDRHLRGDAAPVPLRAVVLLRPGQDGVAVRPVPPADALRDMWAITFKLPTRASRVTTFARVGALVRHVPVFTLERPLSIERLPEVIATVEKLSEQPSP